MTDARPPTPLPDIVGRGLELEAVDRFVAALAGDRPMVGLLLEGEAGVGKSMLWQAAVALAQRSGARVLACAPAAAEQGLAFVALHDLLGAPTSVELEGLPPPQRQALDAAVMRAQLDAPLDQGALGVALTAVLRGRSADGPLLLAVDDSQWLDPATARTLAFAVRRLSDANLGLLLTRRLGEESPLFEVAAGLDPTAIQRLHLGPISFGAVHRLLVARTGHSFARPVVARIERASGGNPMIALEIARAMLESGGTRAEDAFGGAVGLPLPERLRDLLGTRLAKLGPSSQAALLVAAALARPTTDLVAGASPDASAARAGLEEAHLADVIAIGDDGRVRFSHPLIAAAVLARSSRDARRATHARLAEVTPDQEERAVHLALAATEPDGALADTLEAAARATGRRGAPEVSADLFARALALTPAVDHLARARRVVLEAESRLAAGDLHAAQTILEAALPWIPAGSPRAEARLLLGTVLWYLDPPVASAALESALAEPGLAPTVAGRIHARAAVFAGTTDASRRHGRAAVRLIDPAEDRSALAFARFGLFFADVLAGVPPDLAAFEAALATETDQPVWEVTTIPILWWGYLGDHDRARQRLGLHLRWARDSGDASSGAELYAHLAQIELYAGRWADADAAAERSLEAAEQMGQVAPHTSHRVRALVDAHLGRLDRAIDAAEAGAVASQGSDPELEAMYLDALGTAHVAAGAWEAAAAAFDRMDAALDELGMLEPLRHRTDADHVEALLALSDVAGAAAVVDRLARRQRILPRPWTSVDLPRARALLQAATGDQAGAAATLAAVVDAWPAGPPVDPYAAGRALLALGRLERELGRRRAAGQRLDAAVSLFDALPAPVWAAAGRREIDRLGRRRDAGDRLTAAEARVVELIAQGLTNRQVAQRLVLSSKTVEAHLARAYTKLGVRSRAELGRRLASAEPGVSAASATSSDEAL